MNEMRYQTCPSATKGLDADGTLPIWVSREEPDRVDEVLLAGGCDLAGYLRNPVVLWGHEQKMLPIGRAVETQAVPGQGVSQRWEFAPGVFAQEVKDLYAAGFLNAASAGFVSEYETCTREMRGDRTVTVMNAWELVEGSAVAVPANGMALTKAMEDGSTVALSMLASFYPDAFVNPSADPAEQTERIRQTEAERIGADIKRLGGAAEGLRNITRHYRKAGEELPFALAELQVAHGNLAEILGDALPLTTLSAEAVTTETNPTPAEEPADPPAPEPDPTPELNPSEVPHEDLAARDDVLARSREAVALAQAAVQEVRDAIPAIIAEELTRQKKLRIGR
jgi:hypothetical protein